MKHSLRHIALLIIFLCLVETAPSQQRVSSVDLPQMEPAALEPYGSLQHPANLEPSGLVKSKMWQDVYWSHNDSGDDPRIFPVSREGKLVVSDRYPDRVGIAIPDAVNVDWEDITTDNSGNLYIGDIGNNRQNRRDLVVYVVNEPHPSQARTSVRARIYYSYPDQMEIPASKRNFNAEALFWANGNLYVLTKHYDDTHTKLYRFDSQKIGVINRLTLLGRFDTISNVGAADATPDGTRLALLTNKALWMFESRDGSDAYFDGKVSWLPIDMEKYRPAEGITFDNGRLIISAKEQGGYLFEVPISSLVVVRE